MFNFARLFRVTFVFVVLTSSLVLAVPGSHDRNMVKRGRRHRPVNATQRDDHLQKRFDGARFTFFDVGQNACGGFDHDSDFIVAMNTHQWDGGSHCFEKVTVEYHGEKIGAMVTDECEECPVNAIDLSPSLFKALIPGGLDTGTVYDGSWVFGSGDPEPSPEPPKKTTTSSPPPPPPTTTTSSKKQTTTSTTETPTSTSTTSKAAPTTTSTSTSSKPDPSSTSTTAAPTPTVPTMDTGMLNQFNLALIQLAGLGNAALANA